jgi:serine/threonine protein kinase
LAKFRSEYNPMMMTIGIPSDFTDLTLAFKKDFENIDEAAHADLTTTLENEVVLTEWKKRIGTSSAEDDPRLDNIRRFLQEALRQASFDLPAESQILEKLTQSGVIMGTPQYMAPEQALGRIEDVGPSADIYSLGAIIYEMLTGQPPFTGQMFHVIEDVIGRPPVPPRQRRDSINPALAAICMKCLEKPVDRRYQSMANLAEDLQRFIDGAEVNAHRDSSRSSEDRSPGSETDDGAKMRSTWPIGTTTPALSTTKSWWQFWR